MPERRAEAKDSLDYFPTPAWATRALFRFGLYRQYGFKPLKQMSALEPACGGGHMAEVLKEYFGTVTSADIASYGYPCMIADYLETDHETHDWVITNPPFNRAGEFIQKALKTSNIGTAMFARLAFLESKGRYESIFSHTPPTKVCVFSERVPLVKGTVDATASSATAYCWLIWEHTHQTNQTDY